MRFCLPRVARAVVTSASAQQGFFTSEDVIKYTPDWHGERFADGRPKVPDDILDRTMRVTLEEAWAVLQQNGFMHQYEDGWLSIHPDKVLVGRALTAAWMPGRPDVQKLLEEEGAKMHRLGGMNAWPVDMLQKRDVYTCDHFGLKEAGPSIGDNVGNAIYARSGNGIVYDGAVRDINGLEELPDFVVFRSFLRSIASLRLAEDRQASELHHGEHQWADPHRSRVGDAGRCRARAQWRGHLYSATIGRGRSQVLGRNTLCAIIFGHQRLKEGKYTAGQIDTRWTDPIEQDYSQWLKQNEDHLPFPKSRIEEILREHK